MENKGNDNNNGGNKNGGNNKNGMTIMIFIFAALLVLFLTSLLNSCAKSATNKEISYSEFISMVENDKVQKVKFTSNKIEITPKDENKLYRIKYYTAELRDDTLLPLLREHDVKFSGTVEDVSSAIMWNMVSYILPLVIVWILLYFFIFRKMGGGGMMGVGKTTAKVYVEKSTGVTFKDVAGQDEAKDSLQEVVDFLHNPKKYTEIGAKLPKGALLVGPPGTGKTLLAKAVAGEAKVPFFSLAGSDFVEMFVGVGASRVRDLFKEAQKQAPCIIFIDEIDAIGKSRDTRYGGNDEREQTLNQLLAEMDGFDTSKGLLILAATNRPEVLDKALLRPGRFDRRIIVDKPDLKGRVETLKVHAKSVLMDETVDLDAIALATSGAVGSDLANMINEAAINAVKHGRKYVNQGDLFESVEVVIAGKEKKDRIMGPKEKKMVAYHEVGHALVTALQKDAEPVQKITIVPRTMGALGYTMQVPEEEKFLMTKNELIAHLVTYMGGRAAEEIVFDSVTTGASNDIEQATKMARAMVTQYGMSEKFGLMGLVTIENQYLDGRASLNCGEETAAQIDQEVMRILKESYDEAVRLLQENRSILDKISEYLYEHETITGKEFMKIFRELKGIPEPEEKTKAQEAAEKFKSGEKSAYDFYAQEVNRPKEILVKEVKPEEPIQKEMPVELAQENYFQKEPGTEEGVSDEPKEGNRFLERQVGPEGLPKETGKERFNEPKEENRFWGRQGEAKGLPKETGKEHSNGIEMQRGFQKEAKAEKKLPKESKTQRDFQKETKTEKETPKEPKTQGDFQKETGQQSFPKEAEETFHREAEQKAESALEKFSRKKAVEKKSPKEAEGEKTSPKESEVQKAFPKEPEAKKEFSGEAGTAKNGQAESALGRHSKKRNAAQKVSQKEPQAQNISQKEPQAYNASKKADVPEEKFQRESAAEKNSKRVNSQKKGREKVKPSNVKKQAPKEQAFSGEIAEGKAGREEDNAEINVLEEPVIEKQNFIVPQFLRQQLEDNNSSKSEPKEKQEPSEAGFEEDGQDDGEDYLDKLLKGLE